MLLALTTLGLAFGLALSLALGSYRGAPGPDRVEGDGGAPGTEKFQGRVGGSASREEHGLRFELRAEAKRENSSVIILIRLTVVNVGGEEVELWFRSGQAWDVVIRDMAGRELWR